MNRVLTARLALGALALLVFSAVALLATLLTSSGTKQPMEPAATPAPTMSLNPAHTQASSTVAPPSKASAKPATSTRPTPYSSAPTTRAQKAAVEAARIMTTWTPAQDKDQTASEPRAAKLMTPERAKAIVVSTRGTNTPQWKKAAEGNWTSEPKLTLVPSEGPGVVQVHARWDWITPDGKRVAGTEARSFTFSFTDDDRPLIRDYTWQTMP